MHQKLLEKMFQASNQEAADPVNLVTSSGGAFTKKQGSGSKANSNQKPIDEAKHKASEVPEQFNHKEVHVENDDKPKV